MPIEYKKTVDVVYYVENGFMHKEKVYAQIAFNVALRDRSPWVIEEVLGAIMTGGRTVCGQNSIPEGVKTMAERPGIWYLVSGNLVHADDCYESRKEAADAAWLKLMGDGEE